MNYFLSPVSTMCLECYNESFSAMFTEPYSGRQPRHWSRNKYVITRSLVVKAHLHSYINRVVTYLFHHQRRLRG